MLHFGAFLILPNKSGVLLIRSLRLQSYFILVTVVIHVVSETSPEEKLDEEDKEEKTTRNMQI